MIILQSLVRKLYRFFYNLNLGSNFRMNIFVEPIFSKYYSQSPLILIDIGASGGLESNWKDARKYLQIIGFEPDQREFHNLKKNENSNTRYLNTGLFNKKATLDYYLTEKQQTSSMLKPNRSFLEKFPEVERFNVVKKVTIEADTLDNQLKTHDINDADFFKIDTQGSELFILQGSQETVHNHVFGLEIEVEFVEMYQDQPLFSDVDQFAREQGFQIFDIQKAYWKRYGGENYYKKKGQLIFGNVLYLRKTEDFRKMIDQIGDVFQKKAKILKAASICFLYGYYDYAREILECGANIFDRKEKDALDKWIQKNVLLESKIPNFKGKKRIAEIFHRLWEFWRPTHGQWATLDRKLGNL